jgi:hypothetical protein
MNKELPLKLYTCFFKNPKLFSILTKINQFTSIHSTNIYLSETVSRRSVTTEDLVLLLARLLVAFAKLRMTYISFVMSVILPACLSVRPHGTTNAYASRLCNVN